MSSRGGETCPDQTFRYSYKLPTSTPMSYPKCEMEFPYLHSKSTARIMLSGHDRPYDRLPGEPADVADYIR